MMNALVHQASTKLIVMLNAAHVKKMLLRLAPNALSLNTSPSHMKAAVNAELTLQWNMVFAMAHVPALSTELSNLEALSIQDTLLAHAAEEPVLNWSALTLIVLEGRLLPRLSATQAALAKSLSVNLTNMVDIIN